MAEFTLPDVGEGLTEAEIVTWKVQPGDTVAVNDVLLEIETAKSLVELPSPHAGTVAALLVAEGATVPVGTPLIHITPLDPRVGEHSTPSPDSQHTEAPAPLTEPVVEPKPAVLVGYGPSEPAARRRTRSAVPAAPAPTGQLVRTKPPVRKLARELGVELTELAGPHPITRDQVLAHVHRADPPAATQQPAEQLAEPRPSPGETRIPVRGVRKATAQAMVTSAYTAPHVTEFVTVDVTRSVKLVEKLKRDPAFQGSRVTMLLLAARALLATIREHPDLNASWDEPAGEIVLHHQVNLGIAAATPRGLLVPNIKDAAGLTLPGLAKALTELVGTARDGRTTPADLARGTVTITNIGVFGVDAGTPILNPGEAAILCLGAVRRTPWEHKGQVALRWTTTLALSFDHRLVDGELGSRALARVGRILTNPKHELLLC